MRRLIVFSSVAFWLGAFLCFYASPVLAQANSELAEIMKKANAGYADAQYNLGVLYEQGRGVKKNYGLAVRWYHRAASQGLGHAQYNLGVMFSKGRGVAQDYVEAYKWVTLAVRSSNIVPSAALLRERLYKDLSPRERAKADNWIQDWRPVLER